jgi:hypothetical protein
MAFLNQIAYSGILKDMWWVFGKPELATIEENY